MLVMHIFMRYNSEENRSTLIPAVTPGPQGLDVTFRFQRPVPQAMKTLTVSTEPEYLCIPSLQSQAVQVHQPRHLLVVDLT